jgi:cytochrome c553
MAALAFSGMLCLSLMPSTQAAEPKGRGAATKPAASKAAPVAARGNAAAGLDKSESERCQECHGADGNGAGHSNGPEGKFAKLAGQFPEYIVKQIADFRSGARQHDFMTMMAKSLDDGDVADIAAYFGSLPRMSGDGSGSSEVAARLFTQGDAQRGIAACASCHGERGRGLGTAGSAPVIGGQEYRYLDKQLREWRSGERRNSPGGVMSQVTKNLTDAEVEALTLYISGLQP